MGRRYRKTVNLFLYEIIIFPVDCCFHSANPGDYYAEDSNAKGDERDLFNADVDAETDEGQGVVILVLFGCYELDGNVEGDGDVGELMQIGFVELEVSKDV